MTHRLQSERPGAKVFLSLRRVGLLTALVYLLALIFYIKGPQVYTHTARELFAWFLVLSLLFLFRKGYRLIEEAEDAGQLRTILGFAAIFCLLAFFTFPFHSTDVFGYINRGWQQVHYGQNPYIHVLSDVPQWEQDPMLRDHWIYNPVPYGFLFTLLARFLCRIGDGHWWLTLLLFKGLNLLAYAFTAWLVWSGARHVGQHKPLMVLYLFLWNPLILMHHLANGHNDVLTGCLLVLALYLSLRGVWFWVIPVLVAATLLKYAPALLIPLALVFIIKNRGWKRAALSCLLGALILILVSAPYLRDWRRFRLEDIRDNATLIDNSLHSFLIHIYENIARLLPPLAAGHAAADSLIKNSLRFGFLLFFLFQSYKMLKELSTKVWIEKSTLIMFVLICVVSSKFNAWYLGILLPPALLLDERHWLRRLIVLLTCTELLSLTFFKQAYILNYFAMILLPTWYVFNRTRREKKLVQSSAEELPRPALPSP